MVLPEIWESRCPEVEITCVIMRVYSRNALSEYSCAVTPQVRQTGNRLSGLAGTAYASLFT